MTVDPGLLSSGGGFLSQNFNSALSSAPELYNTPSLAVAAAQSPDPEGAAQSLVHLTAQSAVQQKAKESHHWWSPVTHALGTAAHYTAEGISKVANAPVIHQALDLAAKPLGAVQHEYRYFKYVATHEGFLKAFGELAVTAGVGIGVGFLTGGTGGLLAAEATGRLFGAIDQKAWDASQDQGGSFGRDVAHLVGADNTNSGIGKYLSGTLDAAFDFGTDPLILGGKLRAAAKSAEGIAAARNVRVLGSDIAMKQRAINRLFPGLQMRNPEQVDAIRASLGGRGYNRALEDLARYNNAGAIVQHYGPEVAPIARELAAAKTPDAVHEIFRWQAYRAEEQGRMLNDMLPSRSVLRIKSQRLYDKAFGNVQKKDELPILAGRKVGGGFQPGIALQPKLWINSNAWQRVASKKLRTFSGYMPFAIDDATGEISSRSMDISNDNNLQALQRVARFALGEADGKKWVHDFTMLRDPDTDAALLNLRKAKYGELLNEVLKAAGLPDDPEYVAQLTKWTRHVAIGTDASTSYGFGHKLGDGVNMRQLDAGPQRGALYGFQADSTVTLPNFRQLKKMMADTSAYAKWYGRIDEFAARHYTDSFFKPLALLTMGFGVRVAMAEAIPAMFRYGAWNMVRGRINITAAKMKYALDHNEVGNVTAAMAKMFGGYDKLVNGVSKLNNLFSPQELQDLAAELVMTNQSHIAHGVAASGHSAATRPDDPATDAEYGMDQTLKRALRLRDLHMKYGTGRFRNMLPDDPEYVDAWHYGLVRRTREKSSQLIAADYRQAYRSPEARNMTEAKRQDYAADKATEREVLRVKGINPDTGRNYGVKDDPYRVERQRLMAYEEDPHNFAAARVDDTRNYFTGGDLTVHDSLLKKLIDGDNRITPDDLRQIKMESRPLGVAGEIYEPFMPSDVLHAVINSGFKKIVNPVIDYMSREPLYFNEFVHQYKALKDAEDAGILSHESAMRIAQVRAMRGILPQIHNTALRSQFAIMSSNLMPFYFAQEQALKRAGHLIRRNPNAFRQYQLMVHGLSDPGFIHTDDQGNRYLMFPLIGEFGSRAMTALAGLPGMNLQGGLPLTVSGDVESLKTVLPELDQAPGTTPFAAIALQKLTDLDPGFAELTKQVLGDRGYSTDTWSALIPNTALRSAVHGLMRDEGDRQFANAMLMSLQSAEYHGQMPGPDASAREKAAFMDRIKNNARSILMTKAILAEFSPLSPRVEQVDYQLRDEWYKLLKDSKGGYEEALQKFLKEHGSKAISYTVAKTKSTTGAYAPITQQAMDFVTQNHGLLVKHPWGAAFTIPQGTEGGGDAQVIYDELLRTHLRERETPEEFRDSLYVGQGMRLWQQSYDAYQAALKANDGNTAAQNALSSAWGVWQSQNFALSQPLAYEYLTSDERRVNAEQAYTDIVSMFSDGSNPNNQQSQLLYGLSQDYERYRSAMAGLGAGTGDRTMGHQRQQVKDAWDAYLNQKEKDEPLLANVIDAVFRRLEEEV